METKETLTLLEIEKLCRAYMDCRLSRLQEKELELVLLCSDLNSPIIAEVRLLMGLTSLMSVTDTNVKKPKFRIIKYTGIAAAIAAVAFCSISLFRTFSPAETDSDIYVCADGKILTGYVAQTVANDSQEETMSMFKAIIEDAQNKQRLTEQYMNSIIK